MRNWSEPAQYEAFFRPPLTPAQDRIQRRFLAAFARSMGAEAGVMGIMPEYWHLELLSGGGHCCPIVNVESRDGYLRPVGPEAWSAHELHCTIEWTCNGWCGYRFDEAGRDAVLAVLSHQRDPAGRCGFRVFLASLQGGFGLPRVRLGERAAPQAVGRGMGR